MSGRANGGVANAMTIDVEDYFQVSALASAIDRDSWDSIDCRVEANTDKLLQMFDDADVCATFFVLGWVADRYPAVVRRICEAGHELASHGYSHELIYRQTPDEFAEETRRSKTVLEDVSGLPVNGYRAASFSIRRSTGWAIEALVDAGFTYDSSIVPVRHDLYGVANAPAHPYTIVMPDGRRIVEYPPSTISLSGRRIPVGGGGYFRLFPYWFSRWALNSINRSEGKPFTFYLHPWEVDPDQPRVKTNNLKSRFRHYNNLHKCEARLERLLSHFRFTTKEQVLASLELPDVSFADILESGTS
ncbi:MAG: DUF3473 domain-containing protein [Woeseiaceae bacterium]|nr:DUF3473 domain-containing protein [Woeseiaceae bacterium]